MYFGYWSTWIFLLALTLGVLVLTMEWFRASLLKLFLGSLFVKAFLTDFICQKSKRLLAFTHVLGRLLSSRSKGFTSWMNNQRGFQLSLMTALQTDPVEATQILHHCDDRFFHSKRREGKLYLLRYNSEKTNALNLGKTWLGISSQIPDTLSDLLWLDFEGQKWSRQNWIHTV